MTTIATLPDARPGLTLTTGDIAKMLNVAPRTAAKWYDSGRLRGYRLPGTTDRRFRATDVAAFCVANGMTVHADLRRYLPDAARVLVCLSQLDLAAELPGVPIALARSEFDIGLVCRDVWPDVCVVDAADGRYEALGVSRQLRERCGWAKQARFVWVGNEDEGCYPLTDEFDAVIVRPCGAQQVAAAVRKCLE